MTSTAEPPVSIYPRQKAGHILKLREANHSFLKVNLAASYELAFVHSIVNFLAHSTLRLSHWYLVAAMSLKKSVKLSLNFAF